MPNRLLRYTILVVIILSQCLAYSEETQSMKPTTPKLITDIAEYDISVHEWKPKDVTEEITKLLDSEKSIIREYGKTKIAGNPYFGLSLRGNPISKIEHINKSLDIRYSLLGINNNDGESAHINVYTNYNNTYETHSDDGKHYYLKNNDNNIIYDLTSDIDYPALFPENNLNSRYSITYNFNPSENRSWWYSIQSEGTNNRIGVLIISDAEYSKEIIFEENLNVFSFVGDEIIISDAGNRAFISDSNKYYIFNLDDLNIVHNDYPSNFICMNKDCSVILWRGINSFGKAHLETGKATRYSYKEDIIYNEHMLSPDGNLILTRYIEINPLSFIETCIGKIKSLLGKFYKKADIDQSNFVIYHENDLYLIDFHYSHEVSAESIENNGNVIFSICKKPKYKENDKYEEYRLYLKMVNTNSIRKSKVSKSRNLNKQATTCPISVQYSHTILSRHNHYSAIDRLSYASLVRA